MRRIQLTGIENSIHEKLNTSSNKVKKAEKTVLFRTEISHHIVVKLPSRD